MTVDKTQPIHIINKKALRHPLRWVGLKLAGVAENHPRLAKAAKWTAPFLTALAAGVIYDQATCAPVLSDLALYTGAGFVGGAAADGLVVMGVGRAAARQQLAAQNVEAMKKELETLRDAYDRSLEKHDELKNALREQRKEYQKLLLMQQQQREQAQAKEEIDFSRLEQIDLERNYSEVHQLGEGGYGDVFLVQNIGLKRYEVLKRLKKRFATDSDVVTRFIREARANVRLEEHDNIATVYRVGKVGETYGFTMKHIDGKDLCSYRHDNGGRLQPEEVIRILIEVLKGLHYIHFQGIVHRDVKPENIMITFKEGKIMLLDFGIAIVGKDVRRLTKEGVIFGTPAYMSPEQMVGTSESVDYRSDIYAVGAVAFELLEGRLPYGEIDESQPIKYMSRAAHTDVKEALENSEIPDYFHEFIIGTMERNPDNRWTEHAQLISHLEGMARGFERTAVGPNPVMPEGAG